MEVYNSSMNDFLIKKIEQKDLEAFVELWNQGYEMLTSSKFKMTYEKALKGFTSQLFNYTGLYKNNQLVGFMLLKEDGNEIWIKHLLIDKNEREKGLGGMLIKEVINTKDKEIFTEVLKENETAIKFVQENGFEVLKNDLENNQFIFKFKM